MLFRSLTNRFKAMLLAGELQVGLWSVLADAVAAEVCAGAGFDWMLLDVEHAPNDLRSILRQLQALAAYGAHPVVRPRSSDPDVIKQLLDIGAQTLLVPMVAFFFHARLFDRPFYLAGLLGLGTIGYAAVGTLFAAMLVRARTRDVLLPILLYPVTIPVIIAGVRGTSALLEAPPDLPVATLWLSLLGFFDVVFVTLSL